MGALGSQKLFLLTVLFGRALEAVAESLIQWHSIIYEMLRLEAEEIERLNYMKLAGK